MSSDSDDALSWEGDEGASPSRRAPSGPGRDRSAPDVSATPAEVAPESTHDVSDAEQTPEEEPSGLSTAMLLTAGVVGGIYLLYSIGWVVGGLRLKPLANLIVADAMYLPWFLLAVAAPALWFLTTWVLTRGRAAWIRVSLLLLGVVLLVPWPFVTVGVIGA
ncbi:hypothetical protein [Streptomyces sp. AC495_CC817]|uniref:hypothetical protein n=1 Tax=Streptomyces sp. AC495_CC817 TaxID=2823900 RepID=UPI001C252450|nr:hypothetical protein [Streptomyces sp. AC495_CC817]